MALYADKKCQLKIVFVSQLLEHSCALMRNGRRLAQIGRSNKNSPCRRKTCFWASDVFVPKWNRSFSSVDVTVLVATIWPRLCSLPCWATSLPQLNWRDVIGKTSGRLPTYEMKRNVEQRAIATQFTYQTMTYISFHPVCFQKIEGGCRQKNDRFSAQKCSWNRPCPTFPKSTPSDAQWKVRKSPRLWWA